MTTLSIFERQHFLESRFRYRPGEHVTIVGPTGCGKSYLAYEMLDKVSHHEHPAICLVKKPVDPQIASSGKALGYKTVNDWPARRWPWEKTRGWLVWPKTQFSLADRGTKRMIFERAIWDSYRRGNRVLYIDDAFGVARLLQLDEEMIELWTEMRSTQGGLWTAFQRPANVPLWAYSQAEHLVLFKDPDKRARDRFAEIGGVDPDLIKKAVMGLKQYQFVYIRRNGPKMCIVNP